jgi:ABC-type Fe3+-hydroxamate transport system substrate-binding protein
MTKLTITAAMLALLSAGLMSGCSGTAAESPDVSDSVRRSLDQAGLKNVTVSEDRDQGVVTLGGHVTNDADKLQAETVAKSLAGAQVVADQIAVIPVGVEKEAKAVNSDLDDGIEKKSGRRADSESPARECEVCGEECGSHVDRRSKFAKQARPGRISGQRGA